MMAGRTKGFDDVSDQRSLNMAAIRGKNTTPEMIVRQLLRQLGYPGYRLHRRDLPGKPDIAFIGRKKAVLVHGCFWHGHNCSIGSRRPKSRQDYWLPKIVRNQTRDSAHLSALSSMGWQVLVIWECEIRRSDLADRLHDFMQSA